MTVLTNKNNSNMITVIIATNSWKSRLEAHQDDCRYRLVDLRIYISNVQDINGLISQEAMVDKQGYKDMF